MWPRGDRHQIRMLCPAGDVCLGSFSDMQKCPGDVCFCVQQPTLDAPELPSYPPDAPWWAFRVRGSVTIPAGIDESGSPGVAPEHRAEYEYVINLRRALVGAPLPR
jgi:hypothetical protein